MGKSNEATITITAEMRDGELKNPAMWEQIKKAVNQILEQHNCKMLEAYIYTSI